MREHPETVKRVGNLLFGGSVLEYGPRWLAPVEELQLRFPLRRFPTWEDLEERSPEELVSLIRRFFPLKPVDPDLLLGILKGEASAVRVKRMGNLVLGGTVFDMVNGYYPRWIAPAEDPELRVWLRLYLSPEAIWWRDMREWQIDFTCKTMAQALEREGMRVEPGLLVRVFKGEASVLEAFMNHFLSLL